VMVTLPLRLKLIGAPEPLKKFVLTAREVEKLATKLVTSEELTKTLEELMRKCEELASAARELYNYVEAGAMPPKLANALKTIISSVDELKNDLKSAYERLVSARERLEHILKNAREVMNLALRLKKVVKLAKKIEKELKEIGFETEVTV